MTSDATAHTGRRPGNAALLEIALILGGKNRQIGYSRKDANPQRVLSERVSSRNNDRRAQHADKRPARDKHSLISPCNGLGQVVSECADAHPSTGKIEERL
jgi:hypothetical protein